MSKKKAPMKKHIATQTAVGAQTKKTAGTTPHRPAKSHSFLSPSFDVTLPNTTGKHGVNYQDPPTNSSADAPYICDINGPVSAGDCMISSIWVLNSASPITETGHALSDRIQTNGGNCEFDTNQWHYDHSSSQRFVAGILGSSGEDQDNYMAAVAIYESTSGCTAPDDGLFKLFKWTAEKNPDCAGKAKIKAKRDTAKLLSAPPPPGHIVPRLFGDWLHYQILISPGIANFRLLQEDGTGFLMASEIAVAAQVQWRPSPARDLVIREPQGVSDCRRHDSVAGRMPLMRFQGLPKFSLVLWQPGMPQLTVVTSQSRSNPLEIGLDPIRPIFLELNDNNQSLRDNEGVIDLWVKVLA